MKEIEEIIEEIYREKGTDFIFEEELKAALREKGLNEEKASTALYHAMGTTQIEVCYRYVEGEMRLGYEIREAQSR